MGKETNGGGPDLIVLGRNEAGKPLAARFPAGHDDLVAKAAKAMNLTVCKADSEALIELAKKLKPGKLYTTGRGFIPPVGRNLYEWLVEELQLSGHHVPGEPQEANAGPSGADQPAPGLPVTWDDIAVGHLVIAQEGRWQGWWEAIVLARDGDMLTLKWLEDELPKVVRHAGSVALLKPSPVST